MRKFQFIGAVLIISILGFSWIVSGKEPVDDICIPMGSLLLEPPESVTPIRPPVEFPHSRHFDFSCKTCHHMWDHESPVYGCMTSGCHDVIEAPKTPASGKEMDILYYRNAYHESCLGCHKEIHIQNRKEEQKLRATDKNTVIRKSGPLSCSGCHQP